MCPSSDSSNSPHMRRFCSLPDSRVVVDPVLVACVVGRRDDVDAFDLSLALRQKRLQRLQVVPPDDLVAVRGLLDGLPAARVGILVLQNLIGHVKVVIDHFFFSNPGKGGHGGDLLSRVSL